MTGSELLGVDQMELGELQKGPSVLEMMVGLKGPLGNEIGNGIGLGELQKGPSFFFQKDPGMTKVEQYGERSFWLNAMRHWASNTQTRKRE